ncbi:anti-sigma factor antagonist [Streptomyces beijiangensis]|uniref:Anti-sigma factor antagonist n=1 Tax=Streptomyces beijiangensis TaxID=163361 RepID=A0A939JI15_9ACTN|nr:anti-sigma factor antagonist [Streptomyces beijiangensis]MBO0512104.1 anti-sigma factor antagonist [Streptomyces beijiangensis]
MGVKDMPGVLPDSGRSAHSYSENGSTVVSFRGEIDLATAPAVRLHIDAATALPGARLIVDLRPAEFIDCAALSVLCRASRRLRDRQGAMVLVCAWSWHLRLLQAAGLGDCFRVAASMEDAHVLVRE